MIGSEPCSAAHSIWNKGIVPRFLTRNAPAIQSFGPKSKVSWSKGESASTSDILAAWDWCITHQGDDPENPILVINNSLGGGYYTSACGSGSLASTAEDAATAGITIIASSGNEGFCDALASPACTPGVISVGAVYDADIGSYSPCIDDRSCIGDSTGGCESEWYCTDAPTAADQVTCYSNSASFLDLLAPSNKAYVPTAGGGYNTGFGGTSAAGPYAAGAAAVLIQAAREAGIPFTPADVRETLIATGVSRTIRSRESQSRASISSRRSPRSACGWTSPMQAWGTALHGGPSIPWRRE